MSEKIVKKKKKLSSNGNEVAAKKMKTEVKAPVEQYVPGALSGLFGKESSAAVAEFKTGETTIVKKVRAPKVVKETAKQKASKKADVEVEEKEKPTDRVQQKANKLLKKKMNPAEKAFTIFVGNVPVTMTEKDVKKHFQQYGEVESVRMRCVVPSKESTPKRIASITKEFHQNQKSLVFYVKFQTQEAVKKALEFNGQMLEDHRIRVDVSEGKKDYDRKTSIYVGNLPFTVQEDELSSFFEENVGPVLFSRCTRDAKTGMGKGFGFVVFKDPSSVDLALRLEDAKFQKRNIRITKIEKKCKLKARQEAIKKHNKNVKKTGGTQASKIDKFKFSTKRTEEQNERRGLKKSSRKAISKKKAAGTKKRLMS